MEVLGNRYGLPPKLLAPALMRLGSPKCARMRRTDLGTADHPVLFEEIYGSP